MKRKLRRLAYKRWHSNLKKVKSGSIIAVKISTAELYNLLNETISHSLDSMYGIDTLGDEVVISYTNGEASKLEAYIFVSSIADASNDKYSQVVNSLPIDKICENNDITEQPSVITLDAIMKYE